MIELLTAVTVTESQCAYSCLTNELSKMWLFIMRTTVDVGHLGGGSICVPCANPTGSVGATSP